MFTRTAIRFALVAMTLSLFACSGEIVGEDDDALLGEAGKRTTTTTTTTCHGDHAVDRAGGFSVTPVSGAKAHVVLAPGADANGIVQYRYRLTDPAGVVTEFDVKGATCLTSWTISDGMIAGLQPATTYQLALVTWDGCTNSVASAPQTFTTPALTEETTAPVIVSGPEFSKICMFGTCIPSGIAAYVADNTDLDRVEVYADGALISTVDFANQPHLYDTAKGARYVTDIVINPYVGGTHTFEVRAFDLFGNTSTVAKSMFVPQTL